MILEQLTPEYILDFHRWISDKQAVAYSLSAFLSKRDLEWSRQYLQQITSDPDSWNQVISVDGANIGFCGLCGISRVNKSAEYFILIGDTAHWNKGIGTEAGRFVLDYGFSILRLNRIWLTVSEPNLGAIRSYQKLGFVKEGIMRESCCRDGLFHNKIVMGLLRREWLHRPAPEPRRKD
jgi:RimJ/RimL family protein N-acetyltransferase